jgi:hypothetical protein
MPIKNLSEKYYNKLTDKIKKLIKEINDLNLITTKQMYLTDIDKFLHAFNTQIMNDKNLSMSVKYICFVVIKFKSLISLINFFMSSVNLL